MQILQNFSSAKKIRVAMPKGYSSILSEITPYSFNTLNRVIANMDEKHRAWPVIIAAASGGELAAREVADKLGWLQKTAA